MRLFANAIQGGDNLHFAQLSGALPIICDASVSTTLEWSVHDFTVGLDYPQAKTVSVYHLLRLEAEVKAIAAMRQNSTSKEHISSLWNVVRGLSTDGNELVYKQADVLRYPGSHGYV